MFLIYVMVKICMKMCVTLFKMLKNMFKHTCNTGPKSSYRSYTKETRPKRVVIMIFTITNYLTSSWPIHLSTSSNQSLYATSDHSETLCLSYHFAGRPKKLNTINKYKDTVNYIFISYGSLFIFFLWDLNCDWYITKNNVSDYYIWWE